MPHLQHNGKKIYYEVHGEGQPLVILNGIMMSTLSWAMFLPELTKHNQVVLLDFFDQGQSDKMASDYKHDIQIEVVQAVIDELDLEKVHLFGISYGGEVALQFALKYGNSVDKLVLFNTAAWTSPWLSDIGVGWKKAALLGDADLFYSVSIPVIYSPNFYTKHITWMNERKTFLKQVFNQTFLTAVARLIESSEGFDIRDQLANIKANTLIVSSDSDFVTPADNQLEIHHAIEESAYLEIKNCGHASMYERPTEFLSVLKGFLASEKVPKIG